MDLQDDPIAKVLDDLLRLDNVLACMVARQNMISVMPSCDSFKPEVDEIWDIINQAMNDIFNVIHKYSLAGLGEMDLRLQKYHVFFYIFPDTESALVVIVPESVNKALFEVEVENARRDILKIMEKQDEIKGITTCN